ncbi:MAG: hypothetical protein RL375_3161 [Pseudomonadota bacterium]
MSDPVTQRREPVHNADKLLQFCVFALIPRHGACMDDLIYQTWEFRIMNHNDNISRPASAARASDQDVSRVTLATRIHDLLLNEIGQDVDIALMLGPPEYSRAVLSLCRNCGSALLAGLALDFERLSQVEARSERAAQQRRFGSVQFGQSRAAQLRAAGGGSAQLG